MTRASRAIYESLVAVGAAAMNGGSADRWGRWTGEVETVLNAVLPKVADLLEAVQDDRQVNSRDFGRAVDPDFGPDWIRDLLPATNDASTSPDLPSSTGTKGDSR